MNVTFLDEAKFEKGNFMAVIAGTADDLHYDIIDMRTDKVVGTCDIDDRNYEVRKELEEYDREDRKNSSAIKSSSDKKSYLLKDIEDAPDGTYFAYCFQNQRNLETTRYYRDRFRVEQALKHSAVSGKQIFQIRVKNHKIINC